jgi:hypothetical protein
MTEQQTRSQDAHQAGYTEREVVSAPEERVEASGTPVDPESHRPQPSVGTDSETALFSETDAGALSQQWESIQAGFVDEPRRAVERADQLVSEAIDRLTETFARERSRLEQQWSRGDAASTEDLRVALQRYRSFFQRLLSA